MAKITRFNGNVKAIASESQAGERYVFGSTSVTSDDLTDQMTNAILRGWATVGPSDFPPLEWFNSVAFTATQFISYLHQIGVAEWDVLQEYNTDSITNRNGVIYVSQSDLNIGNDPELDAVNWTNPLLAVASIGVNQTWQDVSVSRAANVIYTNTTGRPISVAVLSTTAANTGLSLKVDGISVSSYDTDAGPNVFRFSVSAIVPAGSTYEVTLANGVISEWIELRA